MEYAPFTESICIIQAKAAKINSDSLLLILFEVLEKRIVVLTKTTILFWWEKLDLNQRRPKPTDLQSAPFDRTLAFSPVGAPSETRTPGPGIKGAVFFQLN